MKIRKATIKDLKKINEIYSEGVLQEFKFQYPKKSMETIIKYAREEIKHHKEKIKNNLKDNNQYWIVLEENKEIIGFGSAYLQKHKGVTESIYIAEEFRGKGYGLKILKNLVHWIKIKDVKHIESNHLTNNIASINLNKKLGFKPYLLRMRLR